MIKYYYIENIKNKKYITRKGDEEKSFLKSEFFKDNEDAEYVFYNFLVNKDVYKIKSINIAEFTKLNEKERAYILRFGDTYCKSDNGYFSIIDDVNKATKFSSERSANVFKSANKLNAFEVNSITKKNSKIIFARAKTIAESTKRKLYELANGRCELCGEKIKFEEMTIDHINPLALGGTNDRKNLQCACNKCNNIKGNMPNDKAIKLIAKMKKEETIKKRIEEEIEKENIIQSSAENFIHSFFTFNSYKGNLN